MNTAESFASRRFYRRSDKAKLGGVCAGIADYFGFNVTVTRLIFVIALLATFPIAAIAYLAAVFLIPAYPGKVSADPDDERIRETVRRSPEAAAEEVRARSKDIEERLAKLEKYVTSSRYQLDREFDRL